MDTWNVDAPSPVAGTPSRGRGAVVITTILITLFVLGGAMALTSSLWWPAPRQSVVQVVPTGPAWNPGRGPLVQGLLLPGPAPQRLVWSPNGTRLGWSVFDTDNASRVAWEVVITDDFGEVIEHRRDLPAWLSAHPQGRFDAQVERGLVTLRDESGRSVGFVDLRDTLGLVEPQAAVVHERADQVLLAVVARQDAPDASPSLHVLDVAPLVAPAAPPKPRPAAPRPAEP